MSDHDGELRDSFSGRRALVTGGASFIGSHLTERLVAAGARVTVADDLSSGRLENLDAVREDVRFLEGDLRDADFARRACAGAEVVFHLAAAHGGRGFIDTHPVECMNNMSLDHGVFAAAVAGGAERIVYTSSACVYPTVLQADEESRSLLRESDAGFDEPGQAFSDGEYGWAKLMGELQLRAFHRQHGVNGVACRLFTAYGERENESHAAIALVAKALARLDPFPIWGDGLQTRNFTHVHDIVSGILLGGAKLDGFEVINVGTDVHHTILELVEEIFRAVDWRPEKIHRELDKPVGVKSRAADLTKCRERLGWEPEVGLREGVARTVAWYAAARGPVEDLDRRLMARA